MPGKGSWETERHSKIRTYDGKVVDIVGPPMEESPEGAELNISEFGTTTSSENFILRGEVGGPITRRKKVQSG